MKSTKLMFMLILICVAFAGFACESSSDDNNADGDVENEAETSDSDKEATEKEETATDGDTEATETVTDGDTEATETVTDGDTEATETVTDGDTEATETVTDGDTEATETVTDGDTEVTETETEATETETETEQEAVETEVEVEAETEEEVVLELGDTCGNPVVITEADLPYNNASHNISNCKNDLYFPSTDTTCIGAIAEGWDKVFSFTPTTTREVEVQMISQSWDGALYMMTSCTDGEQSSTGCTGADNKNADAAEFFSFNAQKDTTYYFVVDFATAAQEPTASGTFTFKLANK